MYEDALEDFEKLIEKKNTVGLSDSEYGKLNELDNYLNNHK